MNSRRPVATHVASPKGSERRRIVGAGPRVRPGHPHGRRGRPHGPVVRRAGGDSCTGAGRGLPAARSPVRVSNRALPGPDRPRAVACGSGRAHAARAPRQGFRHHGCRWTGRRLDGRPGVWANGGAGGPAPAARRRTPVRRRSRPSCSSASTISRTRTNWPARYGGPRCGHRHVPGLAADSKRGYEWTHRSLFSGSAASHYISHPAGGRRVLT